MILVKMHMLNFGPFEDSTVKFDFSSTLITGENTNISGASNGTGKSTILQALAWALTGYSRYKNSASIIRDKTDATKVELDFTVGTDSYRIIRGRNRTNKQTLDFYQIQPDGSLVVIKADTNSKLDDKISEITKIRYDSFLNTCYFAQNSISEFMYGTAAVRQKLIAEILDLDRWNTYAKKASQLLSETDGELDILRFKMTTLKTGENRRANAEKAMAESAIEAKVLREKFSSLQAEAAAASTAVALESASTQALAARTQLSGDIAQKDMEFARIGASIKMAKNSLVQIKVPDLIPPPSGESPPDSSEIANKLATRKGELEYLQRRIAAMAEGKCDNCGTHWDHNHDTELAELRSQESDLIARIAVGKSAYEQAVAEVNKWFAAFSAHTANASQIMSAKSKIEALESEILGLEVQSSSVAAERSVLAARLAATPSVTGTPGAALARLEALQRQAQATQEQIMSADSRHNSASLELDMIASSAAEISAMQARKEDLEEKVGNYSMLSKHFSRTGIQANILDTVISEIETLSNKFMSKLNYKPFTIRFVTQKTDTKGQVKETLDIEVVTPDSVKYIEDLSGGEQFRVAFSVRLALASVQARRQGGEINILLLDEVSSSLDKVGIETFISIIRELEKTMKVMIITHDDSLKEHFDSTIHVVSNGTTAKIVQK